MRVLLDTDVVSLMLREQEPARLLERLAATAREDMHLSVVSVREVLYGLYRQSGLEPLRRRFEDRILPRVVVLPFGVEAARVCARLQADLARTGQPLDLPDLEIASIALVHDLALVTANERHFRRVTGLRVHNWLE